MGHGLGTPQGLSKAPPSKVILEDYGHRETDRATPPPHEDKNHCFIWFIFICFYSVQGKQRKAPTAVQASVISMVPPGVPSGSA